MERYVLVTLFHEIALKGRNRSRFVKQALHNLEQALAGTGVTRRRQDSAYTVLRLSPEADWELVQERLGQTFGVDKFALGTRVPTKLEAMQEAIARALEDRSFPSFRITARRSDKAFPLTSPELNQVLGAYVKELSGALVDLKHPDLNIFVHVMPRATYIYLQEYPGPGGLPVGISGRVVALLSGGIDSPVAAWRMMKRGCQVTFVHFHSFPLVEGTSREKAAEIAELLARYQYRSRLHLVPFADVQRSLITTTPPSHRVILYRRFMFRIAEGLALREGAKALVTGESLGQVSSQTLQNLHTISGVVGLPVLRPLIGMDKLEITNQAIALGTYPISIIPDQDCCSLFVPKHPVTRSEPAELERLEASLDVEALVQTALDQVETREFSWPAPQAVPTGTAGD
ncbi:MAG: tRNA uracil 4-sulfurtransferase ThiI [Dehalococcoidia bacterium]